MFVLRIFFIVVLVAPISFLDAMTLDRLPEEVLGHMVIQLVNSVGTLATEDKEDIPVIVKDIKAFSLTNQALYKKINDENCSNLMVGALSNRFGVDKLTIVGQIKMSGEREWLKKYLAQTGEYDSFKVMQQIFTIGEEICKEFNQLGFEVRCTKNDVWRVNAHYNQTKQGFFLSVGLTPNRLYTPWGEAQLFEGFGVADGLAYNAFTQAFFSRFKTSFFYKNGASKDLYYHQLKSAQQTGAQTVIDLKALWIANSKSSDSLFTLSNELFKELSQEEVEAQHGKDILLFCDDGLYKVHSVDGCHVSEAEMLLYKNYRNPKAVKLIWTILQDQYVQDIANEKNKAVGKDIRI